MVSANPKFETIQALRFVAATMVLLFHVAGHYRVLGGALDVDFVRYAGFAGVDVFFVISGFVIWRSSRALTRADGWFFGYRRAARIYTAYWPAALAMLVVIAAGRGAEGLASVDWPASLTLYPARIPELLLPISWTLTFELYFYLLFMLAIRFDARGPVLGFLGVSALGGSVAAAFEIWPSDHALRLITSPLLLEFLFGCALGWLLERREPRHGPFWLLLGLSLFAATWVVYARFDYMAGFASGPLVRTVTYGAAAVLVVWGLLGCEPRLRVPRLLARMGEASYALYLLHYQVILFFWQMLPRLGVGFFRQNPEIGALAILASSFVLGLGYHYWVERPLLRAATAGRSASATRKGVPI